MATRLLPSYARALLRGRGEPWESGLLPEAETRLPDVLADRGRLAAYARVCGFGALDRMPSTYPHVLAFPAALELMTRKSFPLPPLGLLHVANRISVRRPLGVQERLELRVRAACLRPCPVGIAFDLVASAVDYSGEVAWESASTSVHRERPRPQSKGAASQGDGPQAFTLAAHWSVPANAGRRYAAVSGDRNPIHLHPLTARPFGFRAPIAHGMWTKARVLAVLEPNLPSAYDVEVAFRAPVPLPSAVRLRAAPHATKDGNGIRFALTAADGGRVHLDGTVTFQS